MLAQFRTKERREESLFSVKSPLWLVRDVEVHGFTSWVIHDAAVVANAAIFIVLLALESKLFFIHTSNLVLVHCVRDKNVRNK